MIPGSNILNMALTLIAKQLVAYFPFNSRVLNSVGQNVTAYSSPFPLAGSLQAVPRQLYQQFGLDLQKNYVTFYTSSNLLDVNRDVSGDQLIYAGRRYQVESANDWFAQDGWKGVLCIDTGVNNA